MTGRAGSGGGRTKSGKPRPGTGGYGKRKLEGKGPTPPAEMRTGHPAQRRAAAQAKKAAQDEPGGRTGFRRRSGGTRAGQTGRRRARVMAGGARPGTGRWRLGRRAGSRPQPGA